MSDHTLNHTRKRAKSPCNNEIIPIPKMPSYYIFPPLTKKEPVKRGNISLEDDGHDLNDAAAQGETNQVDMAEDRRQVLKLEI